LPRFGLRQVELAVEGYQVVQETSTVAVVWHAHKMEDQRQRRVDLNARTCTCLFFQQHGMPCRHAIVFAQRHKDEDEKISTPIADARKWHLDMFEEHMHVKTLLAAYTTPLVMPLCEEIEADDETLPAPPLGGRKRGRHASRRLRSRGEGPGGAVAKRRRCSECQDEGHNAATCNIDRRFM
jgi:hypothetical protein